MFRGRRLLAPSCAGIREPTGSHLPSDALARCLRRLQRQVSIDNPGPGAGTQEHGGPATTVLDEDDLPGWQGEHELC